MIGVSKRIPTNYDLSALKSGRSGLILVHPRAIPTFDYRAEDYECPKNRLMEFLSHRHNMSPSEIKNEFALNFSPHSDGSECIGALWPLSSSESVPDLHELVELEMVTDLKVRTPSVTYSISEAYEPNGERLAGHTANKDYEYGAFLFFPHFHFEYVNKEGDIPVDIVDKVTAQGYKIKVMRE
jgi:hypothetical protein